MKKTVFAIICCLMLQSCFAMNLTNPVDIVKTKKAINKISKEIEKDENNPDLYYKRAGGYIYLNKNKFAQYDLNSAYSIKSDFHNAYELSALFYIIDNKYGCAFEVTTDWINNNPDYPWGYYYKAAIYDEIRDYNNVLNNINKFIELKSDYLFAYYMRAYAYQELGKYDLAIKDYEKYLKNEKDVFWIDYIQNKLKECYEKINQA